MKTDMQSTICSIREIYNGNIQYIIPLYQRSYVWTENSQWEPLWEDIENKFKLHLENQENTYPHFLGAVVLQQQKFNSQNLKTFYVIDGQQRFITMQYILVALKHILLEYEKNINDNYFLETINQCLFNQGAMRNPDKEKFKILPTFSDKQYFIDILSAENIHEIISNTNYSHNCVNFFYRKLKNLVDKFNIKDIVDAIVSTILDDFSVVSIVISKQDDAQMIFETLNARGEALKPTDLIRNFIFMNVNDKSNLENIYKTKWLDFESYYPWKKLYTGKGDRYHKSELEYFTKLLIEAEGGFYADIKHSLFYDYKKLVKNNNINTGEEQLELFNKHSSNYLELVGIKEIKDSLVTNFGKVMRDIFNTTTANSLILYIAASNLSLNDKENIFKYLESFIIRRIICDVDNKNYNNIFVSIIKELKSMGDITVENFYNVLSKKSKFPKNQEFFDCWKKKLVDDKLLRYILQKIENSLNTNSNNLHYNYIQIEHIMPKIQIEHIMPKKWNKFWNLPDGYNVDDTTFNTIESYYGTHHYLYAEKYHNIPKEIRSAIEERNDLINTIGNLTLLEPEINNEIKNLSFSDKKNPIVEKSRFSLNNYFKNLNDWNEQEILERSKVLFDYACKIWIEPKM